MRSVLLSVDQCLHVLLLDLIENVLLVDLVGGHQVERQLGIVGGVQTQICANVLLVSQQTDSLDNQLSRHVSGTVSN